MPAYDDNDPAWPPRLRGYLEGSAATEKFVCQRIAADLPPEGWFKEKLSLYENAPDYQPLYIPVSLGDIRSLAEFLYGIEGVTDGSNPKVQSRP